MAYGKRIYCTFDQDRTNTPYTVEIWQNGYTGAATEVIMGYPACVLHLGNSGDKYALIKGTEATLSIAVQDGEDYSWIYTNDDRRFKVIIRAYNSVWWSGFVLVDQYQEDFTSDGYINVTASDQVGMLDSQPYTFGSPAVSPTGYEKIIVIIARILSGTNTTKTGLDLPIYCANNLFESRMNIADADDPFDQAYINQNVWINDDLTVASCRQVIEDILKTFQCRLIQANGAWWIIRIAEYSQDAIDTRAFSRDGAYTGNSVTSPQRLTGSDLILLSGGTLEYSTGWKQRNIEVDYGLKKSLIPSFSLPDSIFVTDTDITGWTNAGAKWSRKTNKVGNILVASTYDRDAIDLTLYIETPAITATMTYSFNLTIDTGKTNNALIKPGIGVFIKLVGTTETYYYDISVGTWGTSVTLNYDFPFKSVASVDKLVTQSINIAAPPENGSLYIRILAPWRDPLANNDDDFYIGNIKVTGNIAESIGEDYLAGQTFTDFISEDTNFAPEDMKINLSDVIGDDTLLPYYNGFIVIFNEFGSISWLKKDEFGTGTPMPLISHSGSVWGQIMDSWGWQYYSANKVFRGSMLDMLSFSFLNTIKFDEIGDTIFLCDDVEIDLADGLISGTWIEIKPETTGTGEGDLTLKSRSLPDSIIQTSSGLVSNPGGTDGQLQFKSGGDFGGTTDVTWDGTRLLKGGTLPLIEYRAGSASVASGPQTVTFAEPFLAGDDYAMSPIWALDSGGNKMDITPYNKTITGFDVDCYEAVTFDYIAIIKR